MQNSYSVNWLLPVAALVAAPACATTYMTVEQAQAKFFPGETFRPLTTSLTVEQSKLIQKNSGMRVRDLKLKAWHASGGGWVYLDQVLGKHEFITYAVALNADGAVHGIEVLDYRETWGSEIRNPKWRAQFTGKKLGAPLKLDLDIVNLSGATLSCRHIADGVRRLLVTHDVINVKR
jgi:hypothetical protein